MGTFKSPTTGIPQAKLDAIYADINTKADLDYVDIQDAAAVTSGNSSLITASGVLRTYINTQDAAAVTSGSTALTTASGVLVAYTNTKVSDAVTSGNSALTAYSGVANSKFVDVTGDTMTGFLSLHSDPSSNLHCATKQYVDAVALVGSPYAVTVTGNQTISGTKTFDSNISILSTPSNSNHAATKTYVDTLVSTTSGVLVSYTNTIGANAVTSGSNALTAASGTLQTNINAKVSLTGSETVSGTKTFASAPVLDSLTASRPIKLDGSKAIVSSQIDLASSNDVTGVLPALNGGVPVGFGGVWYTNTAPSGYLLCDGSAVSRSTYANLFSVLSTTYGSGDGSTTFNLPDLRQKFPLGKAAAGTGNTIATSGGSIDHTHLVPGHFHDMNGGGYGGATLTVDINHDHGSVTTSQAPAHEHLTHAATSANSALTSSNFAGTGRSDSAGDYHFGMDNAGTGTTANVGRTNATNAHDHTVDLPALGTTNKTPTGRIGNVNSGYNGDNHSLFTEDTNPPYLVVNYIIKY